MIKETKVVQNSLNFVQELKALEHLDQGWIFPNIN